MICSSVVAGIGVLRASSLRQKHAAPLVVIEMVQMLTLLDGSIAEIAVDEPIAIVRMGK